MSEPKPKDIPKKTENLVITCSDHRFQRMMSKLLRQDHQVDIERSDRLAIPGASQSVVEDGALIRYIQTLHKLHDFENVLIIDHEECGAFPAYDDEQQEYQAHFDSLSKAAAGIHQVLPKVVVVKFIATLDGELIQAS